MNWQMHYQSGGQQFRSAAADRKTALAIACTLLHDGHDVMNRKSTAGEAILTTRLNVFASDDASPLVVPPSGSIVVFEALQAKVWPGHGPYGLLLEDISTPSERHAYIMYDDNAVRNSLSALLDPRRRRRGRCRPSANASVFVVILACSDKSSSMRYENGYLRIAQNPLGKATKNPLAQSTMAIAAHHQ